MTVADDAVSHEGRFLARWFRGCRLVETWPGFRLAPSIAPSPRCREWVRGRVAGWPGSNSRVRWQTGRTGLLPVEHNPPLPQFPAGPQRVTDLQEGTAFHPATARAEPIR